MLERRGVWLGDALPAREIKVTDLNGSVVLITGAASGIGRLMAQRIGAEGGRLVLWDVDEEGLDALTDALRAAGARVHGYVCDLSNRVAVRQVAAQAQRECGPVDVLINNAGVVSGKQILDASDEEIERTFHVNTLALFWTTRAFLPGMLERKRGHIVTIASAGGIVGTAKLTDYCASKFAAVGFDDSLRLELRRQGSGIRTTLVCPFYINTGMFAGVKTRFPLLLPILEPRAVADRVVRAIRRDQHRVVMPWFVYTSWLVRVLPVPIFDAIMGFFGISRSMEEFRGRTTAASSRDLHDRRPAAPGTSASEGESQP